MNRIYRLIWNQALGAFIPVAETARGRSKGTRRALSAAALSITAALAARIGAVPVLINDPSSVRLWVELNKAF
jgi:hypothetical protein